MAKRRAAADSEDEGIHSVNDSPASKRARTEETDDHEEEPAPSRHGPRGNGKGKARHVDEDEDDADEEDQLPADPSVEDDEQFEQRNEKRVRAALDAKRKVHGGIAEFGIIEAIEMTQFMCHKLLKFQFGPQINFIIGHNGSGKSAVLSAITVALGGKATSTGRGNGLKSFIREGQSVAEVSVTMKNQGDEAYKPKEYGKSIIVTRRFTKEGSSSWKIKSKEGKVISTKKDELAAICDHMNIQVDNPMNVLTQDAARQFLSASTSGDKYKFFLRGTQLSQLSDEYDTCFANITATTKVLQQKKEATPDLRAAFREATIRFEEAAKAREQKKKVDELKKELAWAHVKGKEDEMTKKIEEAAKASRRLPKIEDSIKVATAKFDAATAKVTELENEHRDLGDIDHLNKQKADIGAQLRDNKSKLTDFNADVRQINLSLQGTNKQIEGYNQQIEEESRRMALHTQAKHEETQRKLEEARAAVASAQDAINELLPKKAEYTSAANNSKEAGMAAEREKNALKNKITEYDAMLERCARAEQDRYAPYGKDIRDVLDRIAKMKWAGEKPIGPMGLFVNIRDAEKWGALLRTQLGNLLTAFAVSNGSDMKQLKQLFMQSGNHHIQIIITQKDLFDYSRGEPPKEYLTVLRALEISDEHVLRIMINKAGIERQLIAPTRREAEQALRNQGGSGSAWSADWFLVRKFGEGGGSSSGLPRPRPNDPTNLLLTGRDAASEMRHYQGEKALVEQEYKDLLGKVDRLRKQHSQAREALDALIGEERRAGDRLRHARTTLNNLQNEANEELPAGIAGFEAAKEEAETEKTSLLEQFTDVQRQKTEAEKLQSELKQRQDKIKAQISEFEDKKHEVGTRIEEAVEDRMNAQNSIKHYESKLAEEKAKVHEIEETARLLEEEFKNWTAKAQEYCERVVTKRSPADIQKNLDATQKALKEREKRHGASVEDMTIEVNKAKAKLDAAERDLKQMSSLNKALKASLITRLARWQEFRRHIALRCKFVFQYHLSQRGYYGKILFDHSRGTLDLRVQTDDQAMTQGGSRDKDPRSLSGGEKSFSTICLLLSLWESIGCPLRCLDEFDVFMDAVNRRISMKLMIDTANQSDKKQYILITPQDMTNVNITSSVRVHRMRDPDRSGNQGTLNFTS